MAICDICTMDAEPHSYADGALRFCLSCRGMSHFERLLLLRLDSIGAQLEAIGEAVSYDLSDIAAAVRGEVQTEEE
jgi:hypothetical protein